MHLRCVTLLREAVKNGDQAYAALKKELAHAKEIILELKQTIAELKVLNDALEERLRKSDLVTTLFLNMKIARMEKLMSESDQRASTLATKNALLEAQLRKEKGKSKQYKYKLSDALTGLNREQSLHKEANDRAAMRDAKQKSEINRLTQELVAVQLENQAASVSHSPTTPKSNIYRQFTTSTTGSVTEKRSPQLTARTLVI